MPLIVNKVWYSIPLFHGPHRWPFWRWFKLRLCSVIYVEEPDKAFRLWLYTRKGSGFIEFVLEKKHNAEIETNQPDRG